MSFNANDFLQSGGFNSSVTSLVEAKTYNWSVLWLLQGFAKTPASHDCNQAFHSITH